MTRLLTRRLVLRPWEERDRDLFYEINSDPLVMEFFPFRRNREEADAFLDHIMARQMERPTFQAIELAETGEGLGFCGLHQAGVEPFFPADTVEIGWRLTRHAWGHGYASEAAMAWLAHGFETLGLEEIVSYAVFNNLRSMAVMDRIGMKPDPQRDFGHPTVPDTHPHLKRHVVYRMTAQQWRQNR
ncbi:GNAT family N-acetyltransferase [Oricola sp.]|uniref:GNAT family N-acetyltransferase n=1 Tax=Oricola sp. TaxID=1979950 RepID=UPI003BACA97A